MISATDIFLPSLPKLTKYFRVNADVIQLSIPIFLWGSVIAAPIYGLLADIFGRVLLLSIGIGIFLFGTLLCIFSDVFTIFLIGRFIQGLGSIVAPVIGLTLIQDLYRGDESARILSWMGSIGSFVPIVAPSLGGYIHVVFGWKANFVLICLLAVICLILVLFSNFKEKIITNNVRFSLGIFLNTCLYIIRDKYFLSYVSFFALLNAGTFCYLTIIPFYFENALHLSPDIFGIYLSTSAMFYIVGTVVTPMLLRLLSIKQTIFFAIGLTIVGSCSLVIVSFLFSSIPFLIVISIGIYFCGTAIVWGPTTSKALQRFENIRGTASGVRSVILTSSFALGGIAGSILDDSSLLPLSFFLLFLTFICTIVLYIIDE